MSNEKKPFFSKFVGMSKVTKLIVVCLIIAVASGTALGLVLTSNSIASSPSGPTNSGPHDTATPIPTATPTPTPTAVPVFSGTLTPVAWAEVTDPGTHNPAKVFNGDVLTLSTTLSYAPTNPQSVWFYYSNAPISVDSHNLPTDMSVLSGINIGTSSGTSASVSFTVPSTNSYYFIAIIPTPS